MKTASYMNSKTMETFIKRTLDFDVDKLSFGALKVLETGGRMVYMNYGGDPILIQTPKMYVPFGLSTFANDDEAKPKYSIDLAFKNIATKNVEKKFHDMMKSIDTKVLEGVFENSSSWLKKKFQSIEVIEALYTPSIKNPKDKKGDDTDKYPKTFKINIPSKNGEFTTKAFDEQGNDIEFKDLLTTSKGSEITAIIQCSGIWIAGGKFGCSWRALQLRVNRQTKLPACAFQYDDDDCFDDVKVDDSDCDDADFTSGANDIKLEDDDIVMATNDVVNNEVNNDKEVNNDLNPMEEDDTTTNSLPVVVDGADEAEAKTPTKGSKKGSTKKK